MRPDLARDPFLAPVVDRWGEAAAFEAGWFADGDPTAPLDDVRWLCTPTAHVRAGLAATADRPGPPVALVSTGGFFPVHDGHLGMMAAARRDAEQAGWRVVGGYLSPAHDRYVALKCGCAPEQVPVSVSWRLARAEAEAARAGGWLAVDPWEAAARRVSVNFTDVVARLGAYLRHHVDPTVEVAFVCGGDNARFSLAFALEGRCIVVGRPGHRAEVARWRTDPRPTTDGRTRWVDAEHDAASSRLRPVPVATAPHRLVLRVDDERAVRSLGLDAPAWRAFVAAATDALAAALDPTTRLVRIDLADLADLTASFASPAPAPVVSLDPFLAGDASFGVSRRFDLGGLRLLDHVARPGTPPLDDQVAALGAGPWVVRDDDSVTGATVAEVRRLLGPDRPVRGVDLVLDRVLAARDEAPAEPPGTEIADLRDLLLGADHGGLVVALPDGTTGRAPYLLPYVDPVVRTGLRGDAARAFSERLWTVNADLHEGTGRTVADLPPPAAATMCAAGFSTADDLAAVCRWHAAHLAALAPPATDAAQPSERSGSSASM